MPATGVTRIVAVLVCAVVGTLLVIPTGGEIPVISLPFMMMVGRALSWRITLAMATALSGLRLAGSARAYWQTARESAAPVLDTSRF